MLREIATDTAGADAIHAWADPAAGGAPVFVGATSSLIPPGRYDFEVAATDGDGNWSALAADIPIADWPLADRQSASTIAALMPQYRYLHYDVFTDFPFEGNQLAVFPEPAGLSTEQMQTMTREMNFSECTFIFPPEAAGTDVRMRIFTPGEELPMAGHPTIGSTFALVKEGVIKPGQEGFVFGLGVGPTPVSLEWKGDALDFAWMTQKNPEFGVEVPDRAGFARALGVEATSLAEAPPQPVSCGVPFLFAALKSRAAVDSVSMDQKAYEAVSRASDLEALPLFIFTTDGGASGGEEAVYSRMLAPGFGIAEDPATGGASGPLGCYLFKHRLVPRERLSHIVSLQGAKMRRPSRLHISIEARGEAITRVRVGGRSVLVGDGRLTF